MNLKSAIRLIAVVALIVATVACNNKKNSDSGEKLATPQQVVDNKDEVTFLKTFLDLYFTLNGKDAQELAKKHLTTDFYSSYIENCNNADNAIDLICETTLSEKVQKVDTIYNGIEAPDSYIVQVEILDGEGQPFSAQYDMTVVKEGNSYKLSDSQPND